jgi:hypothetical protein
MLVHHVDHPIAESPQEKQGRDEGEGDEVITAVSRGE